MRQASICRLCGDSVLPEQADGRPAKATEPAPFLGQRDQWRQRKARKEKNQFPDEAQTQKDNTEKRKKKPTRHGNQGKDSCRLGGQRTESRRRLGAIAAVLPRVLQCFSATCCNNLEYSEQYVFLTEEGGADPMWNIGWKGGWGALEYNQYKGWLRTVCAWLFI